MRRRESSVPLATLGLLVVCFLVQHADAQSTLKCPSGWLDRPNSVWCYELVTNAGNYKTWSGAKAACEQQYGYLLSIGDMQERQWIAERINKFLSESYWWFGLEKSSGSWKWDDGHSGDEMPGKPPDTSKLLTWYGENSESIAGNCMAIAEWSKASSVLYVLPRDCSKNSRYICKKQKQDTTTCDANNGWELHSGRCLKPFNAEDNGAYWDDARKVCNRLESDLVSIGDQSLNTAIRDIVSKTPGRTIYWLGLRTYANASSYVWRWVDDSQLTYQTWELGSPPTVSKDMISNTCVQTVGTTEAKFWRPYACNGGKYGYICSKPTGTCANGWYQHRDSCYSINPKLVSWNQASDICISYGASLVQIKRDHVQAFINEYRADFVNQRIDYIWIGMYRAISVIGEISWTSGDLVSKGYINWADGEPRLDDSRANAGRIFTGDNNGHWQVADPVALGGYLCEIPLGKAPLVPTTVAPRFWCEDGWIQYGRNCYKLESSFVDWLNAENNCKKYPGGGLIDIRDQSEQEFIQGRLDRTRDYWIGLHTRTNAERSWVWTIDSTPASYFNWADGEPNNHETEENCVEMYAYGKWNDNRCTYRLPYICKKPAYPIGSPPTLPPTTTVNFDPFCGPQWTRDLTSNYCYMFNIETLIWVDAKHQCEFQGGKLVSIVTLEEKAFIAARIQAIKESNNGVLGWWLGFNDRAEEGNWVWDDGQPVTYLNWATGEPNNVGGEDCGVIYADSAQWNDFACEKRYASICKKLGSVLITMVPPPATTIQVPSGYLRGCREGYSGYNNMCYKVFTSQADERTWEEAKSRCYLDGGDLASVMSLPEQQFLQELAKPNDFSYWIGFYDTIAMQRTMYFKWTDTSKPTFTYWFVGEPNNYGVKEDCVEIVNMWQEWKGRWNDQDCLVKRRFACKQRQIPVKVTEPVTKPYGCPNGYDDAFGGYCLKFVLGTGGITASSAKSVCRNDGGTLASIPTIDVQNHIFMRLTELRSPDEFWIGLVQSGRLHVWEDGRKFWLTNWKPSATIFGFQGTISPLVGQWDMSQYSSQTQKNYICQLPQPGRPTTTALPTTYNPAYCASGWVEADGFCYKGFSVTAASNKLNWPEARAQCQTMNGDLASIHSDTVTKALEQTVGGTASYWIGLNTRDSNKGYVWSDNTPAEYFKWRNDKQPDNINDKQNCGLLDPSSDMSWGIENCNAAMNWLCKVPKGIYPTGSTLEPTTPPDIPDCGNGWKFYNGSCYLFSTTSMEWHNALKDCRDRNSDLASIHGDEENNFLLRLSSKMHISLISYWIGLNELGQTSGFRWSDGSGANYFNWNTNEPNNAGGAEHCVAFYSSNGLWNDDQCGERFRYICKRNNDTSRTEAPVTPMPGKCPRDYFTVGNKCFRVYEDLQLQWSDAKEVCDKGGAGIRGYLASISNEYEQAALTAYKTNSSALWIGLFARYNAHQYYWNDNSAVSYTNWDYNEPNSVLEKCVHMYTEKFRAGKWNDAMCDRKLGFVCMTYKNPALVTDWKPPTSTVCDPGWNSYGTACFRYEPSAVTWAGAQATCSTMRASLASIHDVWEQNFAHFMTESIAQVPTWIGLTDQYSSLAAYQWVDKWPLTYTNWGRNQPNGANSPTCVYMDKSGGWFNGDCTTKLPVLCRKSFGPMPTTLPYLPGVCPVGFVAQGDSCYFVANNTESKTAQEAQYECQKLYRSNLVSILSEGEQNFVAGLIRQKAQDENKRSDYWIGLLRGSDGGFEWYDLNPLGFVYWSGGEPSNTPNENCVEIYHINLRWNDHYCNKKNSYVCKMPKLPATDAATTTGVSTTTVGGVNTGRTQTTVSEQKTTQTTTQAGQTQTPKGGLTSITDLRNDAVVAGAVIAFLALLVAAVLGVFFYRRCTDPKSASQSEGFSNANFNSATNEVSLETGGSSSSGGGFANPTFKGTK